MANWVVPSFDIDPLEAGEFYIMLTNKDNATLLIKKPMAASFVFTDSLHPADFVLVDGKVKLNPDFIRHYEFDPAQFIVGLDGVVHLKNTGPCGSTEGVTINFSPVISNTQTVDDNDACTPTPSDTKRTVTIDGKTTVRLIPETDVDVLEVRYKIKSGDYLESGALTIFNATMMPEHTNRVTNTILKHIDFNAIKDNQGIAVEITPPVEDVLQFVYTIKTI